MTDREPLATYEQAVWRLVQFAAAGKSVEQTDLATQVVADLFWFSESKVRHDVSKALRSLGASAAPRRPRSHRAAFAGAF